MESKELRKLDNEVSQQTKELKDDRRRDELAQIQAYTQLINKPVEKEKLQKHPFAEGDVRYLPISYMEMGLDKLFYGLWTTQNFKWSREINEMAASMEVSYYHPIAGVWLTRTGAAARQIMVDSIPKAQRKNMTYQEINQHSLDLNNKKPKSLEMGGFAALKAECFKNAVISIGQFFGRDVNREHIDQFVSYIKSSKQIIEKKMKTLSTMLDFVENQNFAEQIRGETVQAEEEAVNTVEFYRRQIKRVAEQLKSEGINVTDDWLKQAQSDNGDKSETDE